MYFKIVTAAVYFLRNLKSEMVGPKNVSQEKLYEISQTFTSMFMYQHFDTILKKTFS